MTVTALKIVLSPALTDSSPNPLEVAEALVQRGLDGIWLPEHSHIPVHHPRSGPPESVPAVYRRLLDPYVALAAITSRYPELAVGTCLTLAGQHDPVHLAKTLATLDLLSGGKLSVGVGFGWLLEEFEATGRSADDRVAVTGEALEVVASLWAEDQVEYRGEHLTIAPTWSGPRPLQRPRPPLLIGAGAREATYDWIARRADGWVAPLAMSSSAGFPTAVRRLREVWASAGRAGEPHVAVLVRLADYAALAGAYESARELGAHTLVLVTLDQDAVRLLHLLDTAAAELEAQ